MLNMSDSMILGVGLLGLLVLGIEYLRYAMTRPNELSNVQRNQIRSRIVNEGLAIETKYAGELKCS